MATINLVGDYVEHGVRTSAWLNMGGADTGTPDNLARFPHKRVQFTGTFDGATAVLEGSESNGTYFTLKDRYGNAVSTVAAAAAFDLENVPQYIRPKTSGGGGLASVSCRITSFTSSK